MTYVGPADHHTKMRRPSVGRGVPLSGLPESPEIRKPDAGLRDAHLQVPAPCARTRQEHVGSAGTRLTQRCSAPVRNITRRAMLAGAAAMAAYPAASRPRSLLAGAAAAMPRSSEAETRGVVLIFVDDLFSVEHYRHRFGVRIHTPNLDRMMRGGISFMNAFCSTAVCNPSRTAMLTGRNPLRTGVHTNDDVWTDHVALEATLPAMLTADGVRCFSYGKTFHGQNNNSPLVPAHMEESRRYTYGNAFMPERTADAKNMRAALARLETLTADDRFLVMVGIGDPHMPLKAAQRFYDLYPADAIRVPKWTGDSPPTWVLPYLESKELHRRQRHGIMDDFIRGYLANISEFDFTLGRLLNGIDATGLNPTIILTSDHGYSLGDHDTMHKFTLWDEAGRAPLVIRHPGAPRDNVRYKDVVSLLDIFPTVLDLLGVPEPAVMDGETLLPLVLDPELRRFRGALTTMLGSMSLRSNAWRFTRYADGERELFWTRFDEENAHNMAGDPAFAEIEARQEAALDATLERWTS